MTSVSSGTAAGVAGMTNSRQRILDFHVISKLLAVATEIDPPQQNPVPLDARGAGIPACYFCRWVSYLQRCPPAALFRRSRSFAAQGSLRHVIH